MGENAEESWVNTFTLDWSGLAESGSQCNFWRSFNGTDTQHPAQDSSIVFHLFDNHVLIDLNIYIAYLTITFMLNRYTNDI